MKLIACRALLWTIVVSTSALADVVISHKTAGLEYPENTLEGFLASLALGVDAIEFDIHMTRDGQFILHHDPVLSAYNCFPGDSRDRVVIAEQDLATLTAMSCHNHKVDRDYRLPSLAAILDAWNASDRSKRLFLEIKVWDELIEHNPLHRGLDTRRMHFPDATVAARLLEELRSRGIKSGVVFNSFGRELLLMLRNSQAPDEQFQYGLLYKGDYAPLRLGLIALLTPLECYDSCWAPDYREVSGWVAANRIDYLIPNYPQLSNILFRRGYRKHIDNVSRAFDVVPWTLNDDPSWQGYADYGFDGIITDLPTAYLRQIAVPAATTGRPLPLIVE